MGVTERRVGSLDKRTVTGIRHRNSQSIDRAGRNFPALPERLERVEIVVRPVESPR
jgi:hypothetical protein